MENMAEIERLATDLQKSVIKNTKKQLVIDDKNFTGGLSDSVKPGDDKNGMKTVVVDSPYAVPVEFGMPSGIHVNFDDLRKWVEGKLGVSKDESQSVTYKIWKKILNKGIQPSRFFKKGIKMTISAHGTLNLKTSKPRDVELRALKKFNRIVRKATKYINKFNKLRNKLKRR